MRIEIKNEKDLALLQEGMKLRCPFQKYIIAFVSEFRSLSPETIGRGLLVPTREIRRPTRSHGRGSLKKVLFWIYDSQGRQKTIIRKGLFKQSDNFNSTTISTFTLTDDDRIFGKYTSCAEEKKLSFKIHFVTHVGPSCVVLLPELRQKVTLWLSFWSSSPTAAFEVF